MNSTILLSVQLLHINLRQQKNLWTISISSYFENDIKSKAEIDKAIKTRQEAFSRLPSILTVRIISHFTGATENFNYKVGL